MDVSIEVTSREPDVGARLGDLFAPGMAVHVTFLPDDDLRDTRRCCAGVRRAGFVPVPHLTARNFESAGRLDDHLVRLAAEAGVTRALVIAGDVAAPRGPFASSLDVIRGGALARHGIVDILVAGYPEGHPVVSEAALDEALNEKLMLCPGAGIVTQFCFEAAPIAAWIARQRVRGITAPVRIGLAGPASVATLLRFAARCGIGNSVRGLRRIGLAVALPDELLRELMPVEAIHLYTFGGLKKTAAWLARSRAG